MSRDVHVGMNTIHDQSENCMNVTPLALQHSCCQGHLYKCFDWQLLEELNWILTCVWLLALMHNYYNTYLNGRGLAINLYYQHPPNVISGYSPAHPLAWDVIYLLVIHEHASETSYMHVSETSYMGRTACTSPPHWLAVA